jgi:uncharacterized repeat protein (TIGR01451 family)
MPSMASMGRRICCALLAAACLIALSGCFGFSSNPSYFPYLLPTFDIIQTHAKPIGPGYFANFDKYAVDLQVRPVDQTNPVRTQYVVVATVRDCNGKPLRDRRIEWMLEGVGHIVEVDEDGCAPGRGYKVSDKYAVSYTDYYEHDFTRGNNNPNDDFAIRPGQSWCVITSPVEGDSHLTVYAPGIYNWEKGRVFVTCKWVDANWTFPPGALVPAGTPHVLTTRIVRHTDKQPLANYRVRYTILDADPPVVFAHSRTTEATAISDLNGNASATIMQTSLRPGLTRIAVEVIRPPDPTSPSGVGVTLARGDTTIEWLAPVLGLNVTGPPTAAVGSELTYTTTMTNGGKSESRAMTVTQPIPDGVQYLRSQPNAIVDGKQLVWTLGKLPPGQNYSVQAVYKAVQPGTITCCSTVVTDEGIRSTQCVKTEVGEPRLRVSLNGPAVGQPGVPFNYQINVINEGPSPMNSVVVEAAFDKALKHADRATTMRLDLGTLKPQENRPLPLLTLTPAEVGRFTTRATAKAEGGLFDTAEQTITVQQPQLSVKLVGPARKYVGWPAEWEIRVSNEGDVPLAGVQVKNVLPPELAAQTWTDGGKPGPSEVVWDVGELKPREQRTLGVKTRCEKIVTGAVNQVIATAAPDITVRDQLPVDVFGMPGLQLEVVGKENPVEVGKTITYYLTVTNTGTSPAAQIEISANLPAQLQVVENGAKGPMPTTVAGQVVRFGQVESLASQQKLEYQIEAKALRPGDVRVRVEMRSSSLTSGQPVIEEEPTRILEPLAGN